MAITEKVKNNAHQLTNENNISETEANKQEEKFFCIQRYECVNALKKRANQRKITSNIIQYLISNKLLPRKDIIKIMYDAGYKPDEIRLITGFKYNTIMRYIADFEREKQRSEYEVGLLDDEELKEIEADLDNILKRLIRKTRGAIEYVLSDLILQTIRSPDLLFKLLKIGEILFALPEDLVSDNNVFSKTEVDLAKLVFTFATSLYYAEHDGGRVRIAVPLDLESFELVVKPLFRDKLLMKRFFDFPRPVSVEEKRKAEEIKEMMEKEPVKAYYDVLYWNISVRAYHMLRNAFVTYYLPFMYRILEKVAELIQPSSLSTVMGGGYGGYKVGKQKRTDIVPEA